MIASLEDWVAPFDVADCLRLLGERKLTLFRRPGDRRLSDIVDWPRLRAIIEADRVKPELLRVTFNGSLVDPVFYRRGGRIEPALLAGLLDRGASLIVSRLHELVPEIDVVTSSASAETGENTRCDAVVTAGSGLGALPLHYDAGDIIVVQVEGSKRWLVFDEPVLNPVPRMRRPALPAGSPMLDATLGPGDLLLLPAGYWHRCENGPGLSLHVAICFFAPTGRDAFEPLLRDLAQDELFRVRLTRLSETERAKHEEALRARLIEKIRAVPMAPGVVLDVIRRPGRAVPADED